MATRRDIRTAVYGEIETAVDGLVDPQQITQSNPNDIETFPAIAHADAYRLVPMGNDTGIKDITRVGGSVQTIHYSRVMEAQFNINVFSQSDSEKEDIYENLRTHFEQYTLPISDVSLIHSDVSKVRVTDSTSQDDEDKNPTIRGDSLTVNVEFERVFDRDVDSIETIEQGIDVDLDDIDDIERTIT